MGRRLSLSLETWIEIKPGEAHLGGYIPKNPPPQPRLFGSTPHAFAMIYNTS